MESKKVCFKDLSWPLKVAVIFGLVLGVWYTVIFLVGFIVGILGVV